VKLFRDPASLFVVHWPRNITTRPILKTYKKFQWCDNLKKKQLVQYPHFVIVLCLHNSTNASVFELVRVSIRRRHCQQFAVGSARLRLGLWIGVQQRRRPIFLQQSTSSNGTNVYIQHIYLNATCDESGDIVSPGLYNASIYARTKCAFVDY
jgi:hypothetical protein